MVRCRTHRLFLSGALARASVIACALLSLAFHSPAGELWELGRATARVHRFSTLFTAHDVKNHLSSEEGRLRARTWCRDTAISKVYLETFRDGYQAERSALERARNEFEAAGFEVAGCVTTTQVGKRSSQWNIIACYTDPNTQERIRQIFQFTARLFDEIMIDDFWFTDCTCSECDAARAAKVVRIGTAEYPASADTWEAYRCQLMVRLSQENVLGAARKVNPKVKIILKFPQWYDRFHERGYDVPRETEIFDRIWVGTETRDYQDPRWGGTVQYEAYFIMRWLGAIGRSKCGGGWYDWLGTTEKTYLEQARQTVLGGAKESLLFCYGGLQGTTGPGNIAALRGHIPELQRVAAEVQRRTPVGIAAFKPPNSDPGKEARVFDFVGMLGIPLLPTHQFPIDAPAAFFSIHASRDPRFATQLASYIASGRPVLITDGLAKHLNDLKELRAANVLVLPVREQPKSLLEMSDGETRRVRKPLLRALGLEFDAPNRVALYPFSDGSWVAENFNDQPVAIEMNGRRLTLEARDWMYHWKTN